MNSSRLLTWAKTLQPDLVLLCDHSPDLALPTSVTPLRFSSCVAHLPDHLVPELLTVSGSVAVACEQRTEVLDALPLAEMPRPARFRSAEEVDADAIPVPRRVPVSSGIDTDAPAQVRLRNALTVLGIELDVPADAAELSVSGCVACTVCVKACPQQALALVDGTLLHNRDLCDSCLRCVNLCPPSVLEADGVLSINDLGIVPLESMTTAACTKCGQVFRVDGSEELCPTCTARQENPFGVVRPY